MPDDMAGRPFEADLDVIDGRIVIAFRGEFDMTAKDAAAAALAAGLAADAESVLVDLRDVSFMDSTGVSCLMRAKQIADTLGMPIALQNGSGPSRRVLELTGLDEKLEVVENERRLAM